MVHSIDWLDELRLEARLLHEAIRSDFPDLERSPTSDTDVADAVRSAAAWALTVRTRIGIAQRLRRFGGKGILPILEDNSTRSPTLGELVSVLGPCPTLDEVQLHYFEYIFSKEGVPYQMASQSLRSARDRRIPFTLDHWEEIRTILEEGRVIVSITALELVDWVNSRLRSVDRARRLPGPDTGTQGHNVHGMTVAQAHVQMFLLFHKDPSAVLSATQEELARVIGCSAPTLRKTPAWQLIADYRKKTGGSINYARLTTEMLRVLPAEDDEREETLRRLEADARDRAD